MRIVKARQHQLPLSIDYARAGAGHFFDLFIGPDGDHALVVDSDSLSGRLARVHFVNPGVKDNQSR